MTRTPEEQLFVDRAMQALQRRVDQDIMDMIQGRGRFSAANYELEQKMAKAGWRWDIFKNDWVRIHGR